MITSTEFRNVVAVALVAMGVWAGQASAGILLSDNFDTESLGLNYTGFANWTGSGTNLVGPGFPGSFDLCQGHGRCVDLGILTSNEVFVLPPGGTFFISFDLGGAQRELGALVDVRFGALTLAQFFVDSAETYRNVGLAFSNPLDFPIMGPWSFRSDSINGAGGAILDNVLLLTRVVPEPTTLALLGVALAGLGFTRRKMH